MIFSRFIAIDLDVDSNPIGMPQCISAYRYGELGDGKALYRVECDDEQFDALESGAGYVYFPSLNTPATLLGSTETNYLTGLGITAATADDTVLNLLRALRTAKNLVGNISNLA